MVLLWASECWLPSPLPLSHWVLWMACSVNVERAGKKLPQNNWICPSVSTYVFWMHCIFIFISKHYKQSMFMWSVAENKCKLKVSIIKVTQVYTAVFTFFCYLQRFLFFVTFGIWHLRLRPVLFIGKKNLFNNDIGRDEIIFVVWNEWMVL